MHLSLCIHYKDPLRRNKRIFCLRSRWNWRERKSSLVIVHVAICALSHVSLQNKRKWISFVVCKADNLYVNGNQWSFFVNIKRERWLIMKFLCLFILWILLSGRIVWTFDHRRWLSKKMRRTLTGYGMSHGGGAWLTTYRSLW